MLPSVCSDQARAVSGSGFSQRALRPKTYENRFPGTSYRGEAKRNTKIRTFGPLFTTRGSIAFIHSAPITTMMGGYCGCIHRKACQELIMEYGYGLEFRISPNSSSLRSELV